MNRARIDPHTAAIRATEADDAEGVLRLYRAVAAHPGGLARAEEEVTHAYVHDFLNHSRAHGLSLVAVAIDAGIVGEIHAYGRGLRTFAHVLGDLTVAVHPQVQGRGIGRALFARFLAEVQQRFPSISRVELLARESNGHAIAMYESLGFRREGRLEARVRGASGNLEADIPMAWMRPRPAR